MSSGNHGQRVGFNMSGWPAPIPACPTAATEPREPGLFLAGLCATCGRATTRRDAAGLPRHAPAGSSAAAGMNGDSP
jgi:hypothetical protein